MAQWIKCWLSKLKNLSQNSQNTHGVSHGNSCISNPRTPVVNWAMETTESPGSQLAYCRQQLNLLDPVLDNAEAIVLYPSLSLTSTHMLPSQMQTHAQTIAFLINTEQQKLEHQLINTLATVPRFRNQFCDWCLLSLTPVLHISDPRLCSLLFGHGLQGCCLLRKCQMYRCLGSEVKCQSWYISSIWCHVDAY